MEEEADVRGNHLTRPLVLSKVFALLSSRNSNWKRVYATETLALRTCTMKMMYAVTDLVSLKTSSIERSVEPM